MLQNRRYKPLLDANGFFLVFFFLAFDLHPLWLCFLAAVQQKKRKAQPQDTRSGAKKYKEFKF